MRMKHKVMSLTTGRVRTVTQQTVSHHRRNVTKDETGMIEICMTSSMAKINVTRLKKPTLGVQVARTRAM
jgi:hypothetical protein